jgi:hypothetical protein
MTVPPMATGISVSVVLEGLSTCVEEHNCPPGVDDVCGMAACCKRTTDCPILENKDTLVQQLLEVTLKWKLTSYSGDWEFQG